ncbi:MAG: DUF1318 domain-containing protein, partial [Pseudomonadota bacterium]
MTRMRTLALAAALLGAAGLASVGLGAAPAMAQTAEQKSLVDAAKAQGIVGEKADGYLGFVVASRDAAL